MLCFQFSVSFTVSHYLSLITEFTVAKTAMFGSPTITYSVMEISTLCKPFCTEFVQLSDYVMAFEKYNAFCHSIATQVSMEVSKTIVSVAIVSASLFIIVTLALGLTLVALVISRRKLGN